MEPAAFLVQPRARGRVSMGPEEGGVLVESDQAVLGGAGLAAAVLPAPGVVRVLWEC